MSNKRKIFLVLSGILSLTIIGGGCNETSLEPTNQNSDPVQVGIEEVFADNYPEKAESVSVNITQSEGDLVKGEVSMNGVQANIFYAAKVGGDWEVIYDPEQRPYDCELLRGYNFLDDMLAGCKEPDAEFTIGDAQMIQQELAEKHDKSLEDTIVKVDYHTADHARGSIQFAGEQGGGIFLAAKEEGEWKIIVDGNGAYECSLVEQYDFPEEMVTDCF